MVEERRETNQRRLRLRHLLLLALRVLAILFLAAALSRPTVKFSGKLGSQKAPVAAALVFDTSMRMQYIHENQSRLEAAQDFGLWVLGQLPRESEIAVVDSRRGSAAFQAHRGAAQHRIEQLTPSAAVGPLTASIEAALRELATSKLAGREVYVFTDLAQVSWPTETAAALQGMLAEHPETGVYVIDVGVEYPANTSLGELRLSSQVLSSRAPLRIRTDLRHLGSEGRRSVGLYLLDPTSGPPDDDAAQKRMEQIVDLDAGGPQPVDFKIDGLGTGIHQGYVEIAGADALACDDRRVFTVEVKDAWRLLIAAPRPAEAHGLFLAEALAPSQFRREGRARFDCDLIEYGELTQRNLDDYAAVWLLDPPGLAADTWTRLEDYVRKGNGLAVCLGRRADPIEAFRTSAARAVLPGTPTRQARTVDAFLAPGMSSHPILSEFRQLDQTVPWEFFPVRRCWQMKDLADGASVIVSLNDGHPVILERALGAGRVLAMTTPISDSRREEPWNELPADDAWPFLILVNGMTSYLVGSLGESLNYTAGQPVTLQLDPHDTHRSYAMTAPGDFEVRLTPDLTKNNLIVNSTDAVGNYRVAAGGADDRYLRGFSVNLASEQTDLTRIDEEHLTRIFGDTPFQMARQRSQLEGNVSRGRVGRELFPSLLLLLVFALAAEHVLANRFYRDP